MQPIAHPFAPISSSLAAEMTRDMSTDIKRHTSALGVRHQRAQGAQAQPFAHHSQQLIVLYPCTRSWPVEILYEDENSWLFFNILSTSNRAAGDKPW